MTTDRGQLDQLSSDQDDFIKVKKQGKQNIATVLESNSLGNLVSWSFSLVYFIAFFNFH